MDRRRFLASATAVGVSSLAGCTGGGGGNGGMDGGNEGSGDASGTPIAEHPAAANLDSQPILGEATDALIVAFEDPSCTLCRRFEQQTYPRIVSELVETGRASFVYRGLPIIYPWGEPASHVLEATFAADADAFWALKDHYFGQQSAFDTDNVYNRSQTFLASETDVDAEAVVTAARNGEADAAVELDLAAGEELGIGQTPEFYLFSDGVFKTTVRGAQGFSVFESVLGS
ncbi:DsbA family protein [Natronomonas sp. EA1]|uniref:DsbA family protein n=1 Tax=Natronomonas sp. EA1 TaxID=3421655 RepID=UPI003EBD3F57